MTKYSVYEALLRKKRPPVTGYWYFMENGYYKPLTEDDKLIVEKWRKVASLPEREPKEEDD